MKYKIKFGISMLVAAVMTMALILPAAQAAVITNQEFPINFVEFNPCTGEYVSISGTDHVVFAITDDGAGGFHVKMHDNLQDVSGIGTSGIKYKATGASNEEFNVKAGQEETITSTFNLVSQGSSDNLIVKSVFHITINPDGTITAFVDKFSIDCKG